MSYIGNNPDVNSFTIGVERFSGTGACTQFQLTRSISEAKAIEIVISGSQLDPDNAYTVSNGLITFTSPPAVGTNNIVVTYRAPVVVTFSTLSQSQVSANIIGETQLAPNAISPTKIQDGALTGSKLTLKAVSGNNLGIGAVSGNNIGFGAVSGNQIGFGAVSGNQIGVGAVSGNNIGINSINASNSITALSITGNLIGTGSINASNSITALSITGNLIGTGSISANNFAGGGITSNVLSSNLSISVSRVSETININSTPIGSNTQARANVNIDVLNTTVYLFSSNTSGNVTFNLRGNNTTTFDQAVQVGNTISVVVTLRHNTAAHRSGVNVAIDGGYINTTRSNPDLATGNIIFYAANTTANHSLIAALESNVIGLTVLKKGTNSYLVYLSQTLYGLA